MLNQLLKMVRGVLVNRSIMTLQEILDRIQNVLYQGVDTESQDLDLLRHDLELDIIEGEKNNEKT